MGLSIALMEGFAQSVGGIAAAQRQADAQAQAETQAKAQLAAQQAQLASQADEQTFQRWATQQKLDLERQKLQADIDSRQGKPEPQVDPDVFAAKAMKERFIVGRSVTGGTAFINPRTGLPLTPEERQTEFDRLRASVAPPEPPAAPAPVAPFNPDKTAEDLESSRPDVQQRIVDSLTPEQGRLVQAKLEAIRARRVPFAANQGRVSQGPSAIRGAIEDAVQRGRISRAAADMALARERKALIRALEPPQPPSPFGDAIEAERGSPQGAASKAARIEDAVQQGRVSRAAADRALSLEAKTLADFIRRQPKR